MVLLLKKSRDATRILFAVLLSSSALAVCQAQIAPNAGFFLPFSRMWELLAGSLVACLAAEAGRLKKGSVSSLRTRLYSLAQKHSLLASGAGVLLLALALLLVRRDTYPGAWAMLPVGSAVLLIASRPDNIINRHVLGNPVAVFIGLISYPLYLWHWPLLSFARIFADGEPDRTIRLFLLLCSAILAALTYFFIERRIRFRPSRRNLSMLAACAACLTFWGWLSSASVISPYSERSAVGNLLDANEDWNPRFGSFPHRLPYPSIRAYEYPGAKYTVYYGDSNMEQYLPRVAKFMKENKSGRGVISLTSGGCIPIPGYFRTSKEKTRELIDAFDTIYASTPEIDTIVIAASWFTLDNPKFTMEGFPVNSEEGRAKTRRNFFAMLKKMRDDGKRVIIISPQPQRGVDPYAAISRTVFPPSFSVNRNAGIQRDVYLETHHFVFTMLREVARETGCEFIDPTEYLCRDNFCPILSPFSGRVMYKDGYHLANSYMEEEFTLLDDIILAP
jgi:hypothetical protein